MNNCWYLFFLFCSFVLTGIFRRFALKTGLIDVPNERSSHLLPTPRGGGVAVVATFFLGSCIMFAFSDISPKYFYGLILSSGAVALVGLWDDYHALPALLRLGIHGVITFLAVFLFLPIPDIPIFSFNIHLGYIGMAFLAVSLTWLLNLYNFMDGIDGLAGVEAITTLLSVLFLLWWKGRELPYGPWLGVLLVSVGGFLIWNWPPAKIFMGDSCSGFLGYLMGVFTLLTSSEGVVTPWTWAILLGVFIVDATLTLVQRILNKEDVTQPHKNHVYQILALRFGSHLKITLAVIVVNVCWLLPFAILSVFFKKYGVIFLLVSYLPMLYFFWRTKNGSEQKA